MKNVTNKVIWILNHYAITPEYPGGTRHYELAKRLSEKGYEVAVFASSVLHQNSSISILEKKQKIKIMDINNNFKFIWIKAWTYKRNNIKRILNMFSFLYNLFLNYKKLIRSEQIKYPDIILGSTVHPFVPLLAKYMAKKFSAKYIFEIRDLWPKSFIDLGLWKENSLTSKLFYLIEKYSIKNSNSIIYLSPLTKEYLINKYRIPVSKLYYIPNGTSLNNSSIYKSSTAEKIKNNGKFNIIFTGSIILSNRIELICKTALNLINNDDIKIHIIGDGQEKDLLMNKYNSLTNLIWYEAVPKKEIPNILNTADVLLLIQGNVAWGSSNKLYDYLAAGKPIVSSVWVPHNDIVNKINAGISVAAEDPKELSEAILKIYNLSENEKKLMGINAKEYVKKNHSWNLLVQKFEDAVLFND